MSGPDAEDGPVDEFDWIARHLRPLAAGAPEALGLLDDAAVIPARPGFDLVVSKDAIVEGVHFLADDPLDLVAGKLLRVNLSDLAAKGAEPYGYFLAIAWPAVCGWPARRAFVEGLRRDQHAFGLKLFGGDTVATPGPLTASVTIMGWVPAGRMIRRAGAKAWRRRAGHRDHRRRRAGPQGRARGGRWGSAAADQVLAQGPLPNARSAPGPG